MESLSQKKVDEEENNGIKTVVLSDSKTSQLDEILHQKLEKAWHKQTSQGSLYDFARIASEHSPIDLAYAVLHLPPHTRPVVFDNLPDREAKIQFVIHTDSTTRLIIFRYMNDQEIKKLLEKMPTDEAVRVSEDLSQRRFKRLMELIDTKKAMSIRKQKQHRRNSAGRLMTSDFFAFPMEMTIGEVATRVRDFPRIDFSLGIFVVNEAKELQGHVPGRNLLINPPNTPLKQVMRPILHKVFAEATREEVVEIVERYKIAFLPVVDKENHILGVIAHEDVVEAMEDLADETLAKIAGTPEKISVSDSIFRRFLLRSPWLIFTLFAGLFNVTIMSVFQKYEGNLFTFTLFFVPLITGMSGNVGIQCSTVLIRSMALGNFTSSLKGEAIVKELGSGFFSGIAFGIACGILAALIEFLFPNLLGGVNPFLIGFVVSVGLLGGCVVGTLLGVFSPLFFSRIGIDPAIASGPIVTAFNDCLSMTIYFCIVLGISSLFL